MGEISVADLVKKILQATLYQCGTSEETAMQVVKQVHDRSLQKDFESELYRQYSAVSSNFPPFSFQPKFKISPENILPSIFQSELQGIELKRTEDFYSHGVDLHRGTFAERMAELFIPDLSSAYSQGLFLGMRLVHYFPSFIKSPFLFGLSLVSLYGGAKIFFQGIDQCFYSKHPNQKAEGVANLLGGIVIGGLSLLTLGLQACRFFSFSLPSPMPKGELIRFPQKSRLENTIFSSENSFKILNGSGVAQNRTMFASMRQGVGVFLGQLAIDFEKAVGILSAVQPRKNNLLRLSFPFSVRARLKLRNFEENPVVKKFFSFLDPATGQLKSHAQILLEEFQKSFWLTKGFSPLDLQMSSQKEDQGSDLRSSSKEKEDRSFPRILRKGDPLLLLAEKKDWIDSLQTPRFFNPEEYQQKWVEWSVENFTPEEILIFAEAALGVDRLFELAIQGIHRLEGEIGRNIPSHLLKKIARQNGKLHFSSRDVQADLHLRKMFLQKLIEVPIVRRNLLAHLLHSPVLRGELLAYRIRRWTLTQNGSPQTDESALHSIEAMIAFLFSHQDIISFLTFASSLEKENSFNDVLSMMIPRWMQEKVGGGKSFRSFYLDQLFDLEGYQMIPSDPLRVLMLQRLNRFSREGGMTPSVENSYQLFTDRPDWMAIAFVSMFKERYKNLRENIRLLEGEHALPHLFSSSFRFEDPESEKVRIDLIQAFHQMKEIHRVLTRSSGAFYDRFLVYSLYSLDDSLLEEYTTLFEVTDWLHMTLPLFVRQWNIPRFPSPIQLELAASGKRAPFWNASPSSNIRAMIQKLRKESGFSTQFLLPSFLK